MNENTINFFELFATKMKWHQKRQSVIAENVANSETPGYQAKELQRNNFQKMLNADNKLQQGMKITNEKHIRNIPNNNYNQFKTYKTSAWEITHSGNQVVLEQEMLKMAENQLEFEMTSNIYKKSVMLMKIALGRR